MADDVSLKGRLQLATEVVGPAPHLLDVVRRARVLRWRRAGAATVVGAIVAAAIVLPLSRLAWLGGERPTVRSDVTAVGPIGFEPADGWNMAASDPPSSEWPPTVWVTNGPFAEGDVRSAHERDGVVRFDIGPDATSRSLASNGILITAQVVYVSRNALPPSDAFPPSELPLELPSSPPETAWEGSRPGHSLHGIVRNVKGRWISVTIEYGTEHPAGQMLAAAQGELDRLFVEPPLPPIEDIDQFGIALALPEGWNGRLFAWTSGPPTLELSTVPLDRLAGDPAIPNRDRLGEADASIVLAEDDQVDLNFEQIQLPIQIRERDLCTCEVLDDGSTPPADHALYHRTFEAGGRSFQLYVEFGSATPPSWVWHGVNDALGAIEIAGATRAERPVGAVVSVPEGWSVQEDPLPALIDPRIVLAAGSYDFPRPALVACGVQPGLDAMPSDAVFFWIVVYPLPAAPGEEFAKAPPWPGRFRLDLPHRHGDFECAAGTSDVRDYRYHGTDREVQILVGIGPEASDRLKAQLEETLSGFDA
ncbi:MAG TPA: hypothetical protein VFA25_01935 [Actinomycetota bacterium]|jgi:hypothetical protein|nr:hypothetical protein [Actinomycetota bacterium]